MKFQSLDGCTCGGNGTFEKDGKLYECICALLRRRAISMPPYIRTAELRPEHMVHKLHTKINKSLFIDVGWDDMKAIIKAVMIRHINLFVRITSDNDILHAYVGAMSKKNKSENEATFETVSDFIGPPDLVIVRLNAITRTNKAASGALEEAVVYRMDQSKPTWLVSDVDRPFNSSSPAYSASLWDQMEAYGRVHIPRILGSKPAVIAAELSIEPVQDSQSDLSKQSAGKPDRKRKIEKEPDGSCLSMYGEGIKRSKKFNRE